MPLPPRFSSSNSPLSKNDLSKLPPLEATLLPDDEAVDRGLWWRAGIFLAMLLALVAIVIGGSVSMLWESDPSPLVLETTAERHANLAQGYDPAQTNTHPDQAEVEYVLQA